MKRTRTLKSTPLPIRVSAASSQPVTYRKKPFAPFHTPGATISPVLQPLLTAAAVLCLALLLATDAIAQQASARILGTVTDQQGAVVTGVTIKVTNTATNVSTETTTDKTGFYEVLDLPIGTYTIIAIHQGFRTLQRTTAALEINQSLRADLRLEVGAVSEQVLVEGQMEGVEAVNPTLGQSVTSRPIVDMPLNGRNVLQLALLQPGVTDDNPDDTSSSQGFNVGGGRTDSVTYLLDGGVNNDLLGNEVVYNPNPDAIAEFRILTSNYTAEYGRNGAGVISVVTKSGTNQLHGSAFDFVRNTDFDANEYFNKDQSPVLPRNNLKRNQFGGTVGGPIVKNRLFFFAAYQGQRQVQTTVEQAQTFFTPLELQGNFSQSGPNGGPDPYVACFLSGLWENQSGQTNGTSCLPTGVATANTYFQSNPALAAQAIIDPTKIDPAAQAYIATGLIPTSPTGVAFPSGGATDNRNELTAKIDFQITQKDKLSGTIGGFRNPTLDPFGRPLYSSTVTGFPSTTTINTYFSNLAYTRTFSASQLNELRVTAQRHNSLADKPVNNQPPIAGFGLLSDLFNGPPLLSFDNGLYVGQDQSGPAHEVGVTYVVSDTFSWVKGRNSWKFGAGFSDYQQNTLYAFFTDSNFYYAGFGAGGYATGNSFADFLVGAPNGLFQGPNAANNIRSKATYAFAQDEWRVKPSLTLSLGIRYEYSTPKLDTAGRDFSIVPGDQSTRFPNAPLGLVFPGDAGAPRGVNFPDKKNFAPRIGFAWSPASSNKTSIRGGFGIFYDVLKGEDNLQFNGAPPFYSEVSVGYPCFQPVTQYSGCFAGNAISPPLTTSGTGIYASPWLNSTSGIQNPFPDPAHPNPANAFNTCASTGYLCPYYNFLPFGGAASGLYFVNPHLHTPYVYQYNLSVQQEVAKNMIFEMNYVGSSSKGLTSLQDVNPFDLTTLNNVTPARILDEQAFASNLTAYCAGAFSTCPFAGSELEFNNIAFASFNSLEASLTKQLNDSPIGNTYFTLAYTWGHSIDNASGFRNRDTQVPYYVPGAFRGSSDFDLTNRITFSGGWDLPFDKLFASAPKRLVKGWSLYPIFSWRTGFALSVPAGLSTFNNSDPGPSGAGDGYLAFADFAPGFNHITILNPRKNNNYYFNPAAFQVLSDTYNPSAPDPYGTTSRDFFRGPGRTNLDMTLAKTTRITERANLELRLDAFNVFNHGEFTNPDTTLTSATFGQITSTTIGMVTATQIQTQRIVQLAGRLSF